MKSLYHLFLFYRKNIDIQFTFTWTLYSVILLNSTTNSNNLSAKWFFIFPLFLIHMTDLFSFLSTMKIEMVIAVIFVLFLLQR